MQFIRMHVRVAAYCLPTRFGQAYEIPLRICIAKGGRREVERTKSAADMPCAICGTVGLSRSGYISFTTLILRDIRQILWEVSAFA